MTRGQCMACRGKANASNPPASDSGGRAKSLPALAVDIHVLGVGFALWVAGGDRHENNQDGQGQEQLHSGGSGRSSAGCPILLVRLG
jgi:hypothetical protein